MLTIRIASTAGIKLLRALSLSSLLWAASLSGVAQTRQPGKAVVCGVFGPASSSSSGFLWKSLTNGTVLRTGESIKTGSGGKVDVYLGVNGQALHLLENTTMRFEDLTFLNSSNGPAANTLLDLKDGRILGSVQKLGRASRYEIKVPAGVAGIRGTQYVIAATGETICLTGEVKFTMPRNSYVVGPGKILFASERKLTLLPSALRKKWRQEFQSAAARIKSGLAEQKRVEAVRDRVERSEKAAHKRAAEKKKREAR